MLTNTYLPHVGGVARSVASFSRALQARDHRVLVVAPWFEGAPRHEDGVLRVPAIQRFNGSDFSVHLPIPGLLSRRLDRFQPDLVHSHHPFLLGDAALRVATRLRLPLVFTHHTMYERYTHYVPGDSPALRRFIIDIAREYADLCDAVVAPSDSLARLLAERGVRVPVHTVPTGVALDEFAAGDRMTLRHELGIAPDAVVIGHVSRLAREKNLPFLARAVTDVLRQCPQAHFLVVGTGPAEQELRALAAASSVQAQVHFTGTLSGRALSDAYHAMDVFVFASHTETQGMVLVEAMAAGVPVVAVDAVGVREVVRDGYNGRLLPAEDAAAFTAALAELLEAFPSHLQRLRAGARSTAAELSEERCTERLLAVYASLRHTPLRPYAGLARWSQVRRRLETEWDIWSGRAGAVVRSLRAPG